MILEERGIMLTKEMLKILRPNTVFATGILPDSPEGINMTRSGKDLRWVAVSGTFEDWTIYCHWAAYPEEYIARHGDKIYDKTHIKRCVPCDDEAYKKYRF
jgi:hypothetical protein